MVVNIGLPYTERFMLGPVPSEQSECYRVVAANGGGAAPPSNATCTAPPARPTNLIVTPVDPSMLALSWSDNSAVEDGYAVQVLETNSQCPVNGGACNTFDPACELVDPCTVITWIAEVPANAIGFTGPRGLFVISDAPYSFRYVSVVAKKDGGVSTSSLWVPF
jgi:hypothetical protein